MCLSSSNETVNHNHTPANNIFSDVLSHCPSLSSPFLSRGSILTFGNFHSWNIFSKWAMKISQFVVVVKSCWQKSWSSTSSFISSQQTVFNTWPDSLQKRYLSHTHVPNHRHTYISLMIFYLWSWINQWSPSYTCTNRHRQPGYTTVNHTTSQLLWYEYTVLLTRNVIPPSRGSLRGSNWT